MSLSVSWNGTTYTLPAAGERDWAANMLAFLQALAADAATKTTAQTLTTKTLTSPTITSPTVTGGNLTGSTLTNPTLVGTITGYTPPRSAILIFGAGSTSDSAGVTNYLYPSYDPSAAGTTELHVPIPYACVVQSVYIKFGVAPVGDNVTVTVRKNGVDTLLTKAVGGTDPASATADVSFDVDDLMSISVDPGASISAGPERIVVAVTLKEE